MRLSLNRWIALATIAATAWMVGCSADSPTPTSGGGGGGNSALALQLSTTNASPKAGACTIVQGYATLNGSAVPDGTPVVLSTSFGVFAQNGQQSISLVTQSGAIAATVCSDVEGTVTVKGTVTLSGKQGQKSLILQFTSNGLPSGPFISVCSNPHSGPVTGGTTVTITGQGFGTSTGNVRVFFRSGAIIHQAVVTSVTNTQITAITPAFPELAGVGSASVDVEVVISGGIDLISPNCFTFNGAFISICANPGNGPVTGGTPITIQGGGFGTDPGAVQVLFRIGSTTQAGVVTNVTNSTINVLTPAFTGLDATKPNVADVIVKVGGATTITSAGCFTFTAINLQPVVSSILPTSGTKLGGTRATILGSGFSSPVQVFFGGVQAEVVSVTFSQIVVITPPLPNNTPVGLTGAVEPVVVKNADCGTGTSCQSNGATTFTYTVPLSITTFSPLQGDSETVVTILGQGFVAPLQVLFGGHEGTVISVTGTQILVKPPAGCGGGGVITVINIATGESATSSSSFTGTVPTINGANGLVPNSGPANVTTSAVVNGSSFFESSNPQVGIFAPKGGTVEITGTAEQNGGQFVFVDITPDGTASTVTFAIQNLKTLCVSGLVTFTVTNGPQITDALNPATGPVGSCTTSTISGSNFFPTGVPADATITNVTGPGTVTIVSATEASGKDTLTLSICPTAVGAITFQIKNTGTGLSSSVITFTATGAACAVTANAPNPSSIPAGTTTTGVTVSGTGFFTAGTASCTTSPSNVAIINVTAGFTVTVTCEQEAGSTQTLTLSITAPSSCSSGSMSFQIRNTTTTCTSNAINVNTTGGLAILSGPSPSSGQDQVATDATFTGTGFDNNVANDAIINIAPAGSTVTYNSVTPGSPQTISVKITPNTCNGTPVTFQFKNNTTGCVSATQSFGVTGSTITVNQSPNPSGGPGGASTIVTISGTGFWPTGNPSAARICDVAGATCGTLSVGVDGGTVSIVNATESAGTDTLQLSIIPNQCDPFVTFKVKNNVTGCLSDQLFFNNTSFVALAASFTQTPGGGGSKQITFTNTTTGGLPPYSCVWTAGGNNAGTPTIAPSATTCSPVTVTWDCDGGTPCTSSPFIDLKVTDNCSVVSDTGPVLVTPP